MKDFLGNDISVGDEIVYAASLGRCAALCHAVVLEVRENRETDRWGRPHGTALVVRRLQSQYPDHVMDEEELNRKINLQFPRRCLVMKKGNAVAALEDLASMLNDNGVHIGPCIEFGARIRRHLDSVQVAP